MRARWRARKAARPSQQQENFGGPSGVKSWVHRRRGASSRLPTQRFYVICESLKFGRAALAATVAAPELIQGRRQHEGVRPARAIRNPCAAVVACWPGIEAKLICQLNDRAFQTFCAASAASELHLNSSATVLTIPANSRRVSRPGRYGGRGNS